MMEERTLQKKRSDDFATFTSFLAKSPSEDDAKRAAKKADAALAAIVSSTPAEKKALEATDTTWKTYRDAELAFYDHVYGAGQGHDDVRRAMTIKLATRRAAECPPPPP